jgi:hypothetical protein
VKRASECSHFEGLPLIAVTALEIAVPRRHIVEREFPKLLARQQFRRLECAGEQIDFEANARARVRPWHVERPRQAVTLKPAG